MPTKIENKLANLIREIKEIKKELILQRTEKVEAAEQKIRKWETLSKKISAKWDDVSSVEEIRQQRRYNDHPTKSPSDSKGMDRGLEQP